MIHQPRIISTGNAPAETREANAPLRCRLPDSPSSHPCHRLGNGRVILQWRRTAWATHRLGDAPLDGHCTAPTRPVKGPFRTRTPAREKSARPPRHAMRRSSNAFQTPFETVAMGFRAKRRTAPLRERRRHACVASGGGFPGGGDKGPPRDGRQSPQPVRRQQTPRRYAHKRHFRYQTVGPGECEIVVVIVETGPADIIDKTLRRNAAIGQNDLVVLKLHMPPGEPRRHLGKRQEADRRSRSAVTVSGLLGRSGPRAPASMRTGPRPTLKLRGLTTDCRAHRITGVDLPSWVSTRSPGCRVSMVLSPSGVKIVVPVAKRLKTCAEVFMNPVEAPPPVKGARSNASF